MLMPDFYSLIPVLRVGISWKPYWKISPKKKRKSDTWVDNVNILLMESNDEVQ